MPIVHCNFCGANIERDAAFARSVGKKHFYYCNEDHCNLKILAEEKKQEQQRQRQLIAEENRKKRAKFRATNSNKNNSKKEDKDVVYDTISDIFGWAVVNQLLFIEWSKWNKICDNKTIKKFLDENRERIINALRRIDDENRKIRYFSAILQRGLPEFKPPIRIEEPIKENSVVFIDPTSLPKKERKRRTFQEDDEI